MNLILGTANFGNKYGRELKLGECFDILDAAERLGIWALDTAPSYGKSEKIIKAWKVRTRSKMLVFSKATSKLNNIIGDIILLHDENEVNSYSKYDGVSFYTPELAEDYDGWIQAPFNPLNFTFKEFVASSRFIARSIFCGGKAYDSAERKNMARLTFGFLRSHGVKNCVFGVESVEELEANVKMAKQDFVFDTRLV